MAALAHNVLKMVRNWAVAQAPLTRHRPLPALQRMPDGRRRIVLRRPITVVLLAKFVYPGPHPRSPITPQQSGRLSQRSR